MLTHVRAALCALIALLASEPEPAPLVRTAIRVVDSHSKPVPFAEIRASRDGASLARTGADGTAIASLPPGGLDVTVRARHHRIATLRAFVGGVIVLRPRVRVRASVVATGASLPPGTVLLLHFRAVRSTPVAARNEVGVCRALPGTAPASLQRSGPTEVAITLSDARNARGGYVFTDHPYVPCCRVRVHVVDADAPQSVSVVVPGARLREAIRRLREVAERWPGRQALAPRRASCDNGR